MAEESPEDRATAALREAQQLTEQARDAEKALEAGQLEDEAVETLVEGVGKALINGLDKPVGWYARIVADECDYYSRTDIKQRIKDKSEELDVKSANKQKLDEFVESRLDRVIVHRSTDAKQGAKYTWDFDTFKVQTESGKDGRGHYNWPNFRDYIHESGGPNLAKPDKDRRSGDDWRDFMVDLIDDRADERQITGKRTKAVKQLQGEIRQQTGYGTATGALEYSGIWVLTESHDFPEWWASFGAAQSEGRDVSKAAVREVRVHGSVIDGLTEDVGITNDALYQELDARSYTVPGSHGPSMREYVNGDEERFWTLRPDIGVPRVYVPDPHAQGGPTGTLLDGLQSDSEESADTADDSPGFESVGETA
jgi:hypothetical protein